MNEEQQRITNRIKKKVFDFYNQTKSLLISIDRDIAELNADLKRTQLQQRSAEKPEEKPKEKKVDKEPKKK